MAHQADLIGKFLSRMATLVWIFFMRLSPGIGWIEVSLDKPVGVQTLVLLPTNGTPENSAAFSGSFIDP